MEICHNKNYNFGLRRKACQHSPKRTPFSGLWKVKCANRESLEIVFIVIFSLISSAGRLFWVKSSYYVHICPYLISSNLARLHAFRSMASLFAERVAGRTSLSSRKFLGQAFPSILPLSLFLVTCLDARWAIVGHLLGVRPCSLSRSIELYLVCSPLNEQACIGWMFWYI